MPKENVFIVLMHKNTLKPKTKDKWLVEERIEFVNTVRDKHVRMGSVIGDYVNRKIIIGSRYGMDTYDKFDSYIRMKYPDQVKELDLHYGHLQIDKELDFVDQFGNKRIKTVFDI